MIATSGAEEAPLTAAPRAGAAAEELRRARAEVARLTLELRAVTRKADAAEQADGASQAMAHAAEGFDLAAARKLLASSLGQHVDARRAELVAELEEARAEAARLVESAHQRAAEYVAAAHDVVFAAALHPEESLGPLPPLPLEVVPDTRSTLTADVVAQEPTVLMPPADGTSGLAAMVAAMHAYLTRAAGAPVPTAAMPVSSRRTRQPLKKRVLHVDVILPLVAVVAVLVVLLAWVA